MDNFINRGVGRCAYHYPLHFCRNQHRDDTLNSVSLSGSRLKIIKLLDKTYWTLYEKEVLLFHLGNVFQCLKLTLVEMVPLSIDEVCHHFFTFRVHVTSVTKVIDQSRVQNNLGCREELTALDRSELSHSRDQAIEKVDMHLMQVKLVNVQHDEVIVQNGVKFQSDISLVTFPSIGYHSKDLSLLLPYFQEVFCVGKLFDLSSWERFRGQQK